MPAIRLIPLLFLSFLLTAQDNPLADIIRENQAAFGPWATDPDRYEVQVLYTRIYRRDDGTVHLTHHRWGADSTQYFYPASSVKLPAAILALQHLNELGIVGMDARTPLFHGGGSAPAPRRPEDTSWPLTPAATDSSNVTGLPSVAHYVRKILLVSDNDAYNRLFEWLGPTYLNNSLRALGIGNFRHLHRVGVGGFDDDTHAWLNPVRFQDGYETLYQTALRHDTWYDPLPELRGQQRGTGFLRNDSLINRPFDFSHKNYYSLEALHGILARVVLPEAFPPDRRFRLMPSDYQLLHSSLSQRPRESVSPRYDRPDNYVKFWIYGDRPEDTPIPDNVRIYNKVGWAYGYLTDAAYIIDEDSGVEFFLTGTIHVNANRTFNDGVYEYEEIGLPFFGELGRAVMAFEKKEERKKRQD